jgi:hypothetical protein
VPTRVQKPSALALPRPLEGSCWRPGTLGMAPTAMLGNPRRPHTWPISGGGIKQTPNRICTAYRNEREWSSFRERAPTARGTRQEARAPRAFPPGPLPSAARGKRALTSEAPTRGAGGEYELLQGANNRGTPNCQVDRGTRTRLAAVTAEAAR